MSDASNNWISFLKTAWRAENQTAHGRLNLRVTILLILMCGIFFIPSIAEIASATILTLCDKKPLEFFPIWYGMLLVEVPLYWP